MPTLAQLYRIDWSEVNDWDQANAILGKIFANTDEMFQFIFDNLETPSDAGGGDDFLVTQVFS